MGLRPFFSFYGSKYRAACLYPQPSHSTIIEPFAGSAGYALRYPASRVVLCDADPVVAGLWSYLVKVSAAEILAIPDVPQGGTVDDMRLSQEATWLVGFWVNKATTSPRRSPGAWMRQGMHPGCFWGPRVRATIAAQLGHIRHWQVVHCSYKDIPNQLGTWFIDPPYQKAGTHYIYGSKGIDYSALAGWRKARHGQVVVCENEGASWLPFQPLAAVKSTRGKSREAIWTSAPLHQLALPF